MKKIILSLLVLALVVSLFAAFTINNDQLAANQDSDSQLAKNVPPDPSGSGTAGSGAGKQGAGSGIAGP